MTASAFLLYIMKTTLDETLSDLYYKYGTSALALKMSAANAAAGTYIQLMEHPTKRMASYVLEVNKRFASICLMLPATELDDECKMIEVEKISLKRFAMDFVERVLTTEYRHFMQQKHTPAHT